MLYSQYHVIARRALPDEAIPSQNGRLLQANALAMIYESREPMDDLYYADYIELDKILQHQLRQVELTNQFPLGQTLA